MAQVDYVDGFIITHAKDTLYGKIKDINEVKRAQTCFFKSAATKEIAEYSPNDIYGYRYKNRKTYVSKPFKTKDTLNIQNFFFEKIFDGDVKFYIYKVSGAEHFFVEKGSKFLPLNNTPSKIMVNNKEVTRMKLEYVGILIYLFQDVQGLEDEIKSTQLNANSLIKLGIQYQNKLAQGNTSYKIPYYKEKTKVKHSFTYGYKYNNYTFNHRDQNTTRTLYVPSLNSEFGVKADFEFSKMMAEPFLGLSYEKFSGTNTGTYLTSNTSTTTYDINPFVDYSTLSTNIGISFPLKSLFYPSKIYAGAKLIYILDFTVYNFPDDPSKISELYLGDYLIDSKFSRINIGFNAGYSHLFRISNSIGLTVGAEASFWGMKFGDATKFIPALGVTMELNVL